LLAPETAAGFPEKRVPLAEPGTGGVVKDAYYNRGLLYTRMKKHEQAIKDFSEVRHRGG